MKTIVVAYSGGFASSIAVHWLAERYEADIVTVTVDLGQGDDLGALRWRGMSCGAVRAHAIDAREELAREYLSPPLRDEAPGDGHHRAINELTRSLLARKLVEVARIEGTSVVAHGSSDAALGDCIRAIDPAMTVLAPATEWRMNADQLAGYARAHGAPLQDPAGSRYRVDQNLWERVVSWQDGDDPPDQARSRPVAPPTEPAHLEILFERGVPVSVNGVQMSPVELVESLALIAGRHGVGRLEAGGAGRRVVYDAPAAVVLHVARAAAEGPGAVRLTVLDGRCCVRDPQLPGDTGVTADSSDTPTELVRHA